MSQESVEIVRSICAAWELGDFHSVEWAHPEIEFVIADGPDRAARTATLDKLPDFCEAQTGGIGHQDRARRLGSAGDETGGPP
jgi:hypothetical protein